MLDLAPLDLAIVVPVFNERDNVTPLIDEITAALRGRIARVGTAVRRRLSRD